MNIPKVLVFTVLVACGDNAVPPPCRVTANNDGYLGCYLAFPGFDAGVDAPGTVAPECPLCAGGDGTCPAGCTPEELPVA